MLSVTGDATISIEGDLADVQRWFDERGMTDGLPIVPPTPERVGAMLASVPDPAQTSLGLMMPRSGNVTLEKLAVNAVMAGARPPYFRVIVAAVRAMLHPQFNLYGINATTHPVAPLLIVHGPIARELEICGGTGCLGPGFTANATIGRALRLILMNVGGAHPGEGDRATHGGPAKFSYCMTENVADSPWPEFHTTRGFAAGEDAVTLYGGEAPHNIKDNDSTTPERLLELTADVMRELGQNSWYVAHENGRSESLVILCPEHAAIVAGAGFSRNDVAQFLLRRAVRPLRDLRAFGGMYRQRDWAPWLLGLAESGDDVAIPLVRDAQDILILVAGGAGKHSLFIPSFGPTFSVTVPVSETRP